MVGRATALTSALTLQSRLTEETFARYLEGFAPAVPHDLLDSRGGQVRYAIDTIDAAGSVISTLYRLGGTLTTVDPELRYFRLLNPYARRSWSVQLCRRNPRERVRLWYMPRATRDEIIMFRKLLAQLEAGQIRITRLP